MIFFEPQTLVEHVEVAVSCSLTDELSVVSELVQALAGYVVGELELLAKDADRDVRMFAQIVHDCIAEFFFRPLTRLRGALEPLEAGVMAYFVQQTGFWAEQ